LPQSFYNEAVYISIFASKVSIDLTTGIVFDKINVKGFYPYWWIAIKMIAITTLD
jgi:hypothetical protein